MGRKVCYNSNKWKRQFPRISCTDVKSLYFIVFCILKGSCIHGICSNLLVQHGQLFFHMERPYKLKKIQDGIPFCYAQTKSRIAFACRHAYLVNVFQRQYKLWTHSLAKSTTKKKTPTMESTKIQFRLAKTRIHRYSSIKI